MALSCSLHSSCFLQLVHDHVRYGLVRQTALKEIPKCLAHETQIFPEKPRSVLVPKEKGQTTEAYVTRGRHRSD